MECLGIGTIPPVIGPGSVVTDGETLTLTKADDTGNLATVTANVVNDVVQNVALPANQAVLTNAQAGVSTEQYNGDAGGNLAVTVAGNNQVLRLASAGQRILTDQSFVQVKLNGGSGVGVTSRINISGGVVQDVRLATSYGLVNNGFRMTVPVTGTFTGGITPQVNSAGDITGFTLD